MTVAISAPCRKCDNCLRRRAHHWRLRALVEYRQAPRTWFGTLTFRPEEHVHMLSLARRKLARQGIDFETLSPEEQFGLRHAECSREITLFAKRLRERAQTKLRFLVVAEMHKSGLPHYHVLIHETQEDEPVRHRALTASWTRGFSNFKLADDPRRVTYLCKYLSKSLLARVRASQAYGQT